MSAPFHTLGNPRAGGILIVGDHASAAVPADIDLGIDPALLLQHIAIDLGVAEVAALLVERIGAAAFLASQSRLVLDLNRDPAAPGLIPIESDGHAIPGNHLSEAARAARIARFHTPYHDALASLLQRARPALILSLHSFTPRLASRPDEARPWPVGILYNRCDAPARHAIAHLAAVGLMVGDQQPYSGRQLNYTMDRHAEANGIAYVGVELRQDEVSDAAGQARWAGLLAGMLTAVLAAVGDGLAKLHRV